MTVWSKLSTAIGKQHILAKICFGLLCVVLTTMLFLSAAAEAAPSTQTLSFSARLKNSTGSVVADGYYNIGFRLYTADSGGSPVWTEIYHDTNGPAEGQDNRLKVVNGYFSVKLGSLQAFENVDWTGDLWMTMNIGGTEQVANSANINWDGEMNPRIQLSAVPYAMNANLLGGKSADEFLQVGSGVQDLGNNTSIAINKTGSGDLMQFQSSGVDVFTLASSGSITLGSTADQTISIADSTSGAGRSLTLAGGDATSGNNTGGDLVLQAGSGAGTGANGTIVMGSSVSVGAGQTITMVGGATSLRPVSPDEGTIYYDTDTKQLLVYADSKWQPLNGGGASTATKVVAASNSPAAIKATADYVADGTADQVEINAALTAASGGNVYLAEGTYILDATILVPNNTTIQGAGTGTKLEFTNLSAADNMIENSDKTTGTGVVIRDMKLDGRSDINTFDQNGIVLEGLGAVTGASHQVSRFGGEVSSVTSVGFDGSAIKLANTAATKIHSNNIVNGSFGILLSGSTANTVSNNILRGYGGYGLYAVGIYISLGGGNTISDNTADGWTSGIYAGFSESDHITNNRITNSVSHGISLYEEVSNAVIDGNYISESGGSVYNYGIYLDATLEGNQVINNFIKDTSHSSTNDALYIDADSAYIANNTLNGGVINDKGTGTIYSNQLDGTGKLINRSGGGFGVQTSTGSDAMTIDATTGDIAVAGTLEAGSIETASVDTSSAGTLALAANNATSVTIGTSDASATLLVLDTKTSANDPTGTDGAMYYNSSADKFRCYQNGSWADCITPLPVSLVKTSNQNLYNTNPVNISSLSYNLEANTKYYYKFIIDHQTNSGGTTVPGIGFGVTTPSSPIRNHWCVNTISGVSEDVQDHNGSYCGTGDANTTTVNAGSGGVSRNFTTTLEGYIQTGASSGYLSLRAASETLDLYNTHTIKAGSFGIVQKVQ